MAGIDVTTVDGQLWITGETVEVALRTPAWYVLDLTSLWQYGDRRGGDRLIPGASGVRPYRRRPTVTAYSLPMVLTGLADVDGTEVPDVDDLVWEQFQANVDYLIDEIVVDPGTTAGTRSARLRMPDGTERTAAVHVLSLELGNTVAGRATRATLEISIPAGRFE